jgi:hypothetical protein
VLGEPVPVADPVLACAGVLRGLPSPRSAAVLAAWPYQPSDIPCTPVGPLAEVVDVVMAGRRLEGWALWCQLSALARLLVAWAGRPPRGDANRDGCQEQDPALAKRLDGVADAEQAGFRLQVLDEEQLAPAFVAAELALSCGLSRTKAGQLVSVAQTLIVQGRHQRVSMLAHAGFLDWVKLHLLVTRLGRLDPVAADAVEQLLIPDADLDLAAGPVDVRADPARPGELLPSLTRHNVPQLREHIEAAIAAVDPDGLADRARRARADRHISSHPEPDGMARLEAYAGAETVAAVITDLNAAAVAAKAAGDPRTRDQISTDEFFHRLTGGRYGAPATPDGSDQTTGASTDDSTDEFTGNSTEDSTERPREGAVDDPVDDPVAEPDEAAPVGAEEATDQAASRESGDKRSGSGCSCGRSGGRSSGRGAALAIGLTMPLVTWLGLAADPGQLAGYGPVAAGLARQIAAEAARDHPSTTTWQCVITDGEHGSVLGLGRPIRTPRHDPPPRLAALVRATWPTCVFPGCTLPATRCDLDHRIRYPDGPTCACNLQPLCRGHHRLRTIGLIKVRLLPPGEDPHVPPGTLEWTTRAGLTYRRPPALPVPPALAPVLAGVPARLAEERHAEAAELRDLNAQIRAGQARAHNRRFDLAAAERLAGHPVDSDETIQHPPAAIDDDPAPPIPERLPEPWNDDEARRQEWRLSA